MKLTSVITYMCVALPILACEALGAEPNPAANTGIKASTLEVQESPVKLTAVTYAKKTIVDRNGGLNSSAACSLRVARDFIYDLQYWRNIDPGAWDFVDGTWWLDYNCFLRVLMHPNAAGDYDVRVEIDPYSVRVAYGDTVLVEDGVNEYGRLGQNPDGSWILVTSDPIVRGPCGYWDPGSMLGVGEKRTMVLTGGACYGDWSVEVELWNSGTDETVTKTVHFTLEDPCVRDTTVGGYLVGSGVVSSQSENLLAHPVRLNTQHLAGTVRYYVSDLEPESNQIVDVIQVFEPVKSSDSTYGSPYDYAPINLVAMKLSGYGEDDCWPGDCNAFFAPAGKQSCRIPVPASSIANPGCGSLQLQSDFFVIPRTDKTSGTSIFALSYTPGADTLVETDNVTGTVGYITGSSDYFLIPSEPLVADVESHEICVQPASYVTISQFHAVERDGDIVLSWTVDTDETLLGYHVYRRRDRDGEKELITKGGLLAPETMVYIDEDLTPGHRYYYTLAVIKAGGARVSSRDLSVDLGRLPFALHQNHPNPFNPTTSIGFSLGEDGRVVLAVYNARGELVRELVNENRKTNVYREVWDGLNDKGEPVASGVYLYRLNSGKLTSMRQKSGRFEGMSGACKEISVSTVS
jgi:hypothetical protein